MTTTSVLVVDDEPGILSLIKVILEREGRFQVATARNGAEALKSCQERLPDVVLLDVMMPGIDGFRVCELLRGDVRTAKVGVVMLSALSQQVNFQRGGDVGADDYMTKPFTPKKLIQTIEQVVGNLRDPA